MKCIFNVIVIRFFNCRWVLIANKFSWLFLFYFILFTKAWKNLCIVFYSCILLVILHSPLSLSFSNRLQTNHKHFKCNLNNEWVIFWICMVDRFLFHDSKIKKLNWIGYFRILKLPTLSIFNIFDFFFLFQLSNTCFTKSRIEVLLLYDGSLVNLQCEGSCYHRLCLLLDVFFLECITWMKELKTRLNLSEILWR